MRVFVSVDLEGVTGTTDAREMSPGDDYETARRWMTAEANAAIAGAFEGGAGEVVVCDSHSRARNLLLDELDPRAKLIRGRHKPRRMVEGLGPTFAAVLLVGFHARAGAGPGVLNHTWVGRELQNLRIDGEPAGEIALISRVCRRHGVPIALVTGDDVACAEAEELLGEIETVAVKRSIDRYAVETEHPSVTTGRIEAAAKRAVEGLAGLQAEPDAGPLEMEAEWNSTSIAALCALVPGVEVAADPRVVRWRAADAVEALDVFVVLTTLAAASAEQAPYA
jgi:D-amino peptidase